MMSVFPFQYHYNRQKRGGQEDHAPEIGIYYKGKKMTWFGHVLWMDDGRFAKQDMDSEANTT